MAYVNTLDPADPLNTAQVKQGALELRTLKAAIKERLNSFFVSMDADPMVVKTGASFAGTVNVVGDFTINTNKFSVAGATGNTLVAGTLGVSGLLSAGNGLGVVGGISLTGDFNVASGKFTVLAASGNTAIAGTLAVVGNISVGVAKFTVEAVSGNTVVAGGLNISGSMANVSLGLGWNGTDGGLIQSFSSLPLNLNSLGNSVNIGTLAIPLTLTSYGIHSAVMPNTVVGTSVFGAEALHAAYTGTIYKSVASRAASAAFNHFVAFSNGVSVVLINGAGGMALAANLTVGTDLSVGTTLTVGGGLNVTGATTISDAIVGNIGANKDVFVQTGGASGKFAVRNNAAAEILTVSNAGAVAGVSVTLSAAIAVLLTAGDLRYVSNGGFGILSADTTRVLSVTNAGIGIPNVTTGMAIGGNVAVTGTLSSTGTLTTGAVVASGSISTTGGITVGTTTLITTTATLAASQTGGTPTFNQSPVSGNASKWIGINDNGTVRAIPTWLFVP